MYNFNTDDWEVFDKDFQKNESYRVQYRVVDLDKNSFCKSDKKFTFFPDPYKHREGTNLCRRFGGERVDFSSKRKIQEIVDWLGPLNSNPAFSEGIGFASGTMFTDEEELNVFKNYETGELPEDPIPWNFGEPNGMWIENCALFWAEFDKERDKWKAMVNDGSCNNYIAVACQNIHSVFILRGRIYLSRFRMI